MIAQRSVTVTFGPYAIIVFLPWVIVLKISPSAILRMRSSCKRDHCRQAVLLRDSVARRGRAVTHRAVDVETLLAALHQLRRDFAVGMPVPQRSPILPVS